MDNYSQASWYTSKHVVSQSTSREIDRVVAGMVWVAWLGLLTQPRSHLCGCCRHASGHTV